MEKVEWLRIFEGKALAEQLTANGHSVSERTVQRWASAESKPKPQDIRAIRELVGALLPDKPKEPPEPAWLEGLKTEIRMNREVIQAAFEVGDPGLVQRVLARLAVQEEPPEQPDDEAPVGTDSAT